MRGDDLDTRRRRAAYRATHRGTKEMDWIIGRYATEVLPGLEGEALERFERLLSLPDPELQKWLLDPQLAGASEFAELITQMRRFHRLE
ncbi:MAG TPA: succinate dehydrogenase assembly factor 2 [Hyphomicrobiaceae bacterium]|jgi:antitoxin CptB